MIYEKINYLFRRNKQLQRNNQSVDYTHKVFTNKVNDILMLLFIPRHYCLSGDK